MRGTYLLGNWKMCGSSQFTAELLADLTAGVGLAQGSFNMAVFPPTPYLLQAKTLLQGSGIDLGAQTLSEFACGAYTGEVAAEMLLDVGCRYVLVGHSERRKLFAENDDRIAAKFWRAYDMGLVPVLCVGENLEQWQAGQTFMVLAEQLTAVFASQQVLPNCIVAYEPVWAIGTGQSASPEYVAQAHGFIRQCLTKFFGEASEQVPVVYGGSLKAQNFAEILAMPGVDGGLVGGASLQADEFRQMAVIASSVAKDN